MAYDMESSGAASPNSPLDYYSANIIQSMAWYRWAASPSKVILGLPFYGYDWPTTNNAPNAAAAGNPAPVGYDRIRASGLPTYWDPRGSVPWTAYQVGGQWHEARGPGETEVVMSGSTDGGVTWSEPRVVAGATHKAFIPSLAVGADGRVAVTWYDLRDDHRGDDQLTADFWFARSGDRGAHWVEEHAAGPFDLRKAAKVDNSYFLGDYFGLARMGDGYAATLALSAPFSRNGPSDVFFERLPAVGAGAARLRRCGATLVTGLLLALQRLV